MIASHRVVVSPVPKWDDRRKLLSFRLRVSIPRFSSPAPKEQGFYFRRLAFNPDLLLGSYLPYGEL